MKAIVFGGTGFIGSHVVQQLHKAGLDVTVAIRNHCNTKFVDSLGVPTVPVNFSEDQAIQDVISGHDVVYNCTADTNSLSGEVEIGLTRRLAESAVNANASRFIQLSSIILYDFNIIEPMNELYQSQPEYPNQKIAVERETIIREIGSKSKMQTVILRPASTIGARDVSSFFSRMVYAHSKDQYPVVGKGDAIVSLVDTRDIGRAMVFLGTNDIPTADNCVYVLQGFQTTWHELKTKIDSKTGRNAKTLNIPRHATDEEIQYYHLSPFMFKNLSKHRIWDDSKLRSLGFKTIYTLEDAISSYFEDLDNKTYTELI